MLDEKILTELATLGINSQVLIDMPWQMGSAQELEVASQVIAQVGVNAVMSGKSPDQQGWSLLPILQERFPAEFAKVDYHLFGKDFLALVPEARPGAKPPSPFR